jgi:hypothetical protein
MQTLSPATEDRGSGRQCLALGGVGFPIVGEVGAHGSDGAPIVQWAVRVLGADSGDETRNGGE